MTPNLHNLTYITHNVNAGVPDPSTTMIKPVTQASARGPRSSIDSGLTIVPCVKAILANGCRGTEGMRRRVSCVGLMLAILPLGVLVDGAAAQDVIRPSVNRISIGFPPQRGDTYVVGDRISLNVWFDEEILVTGFPHLELTIGTKTRVAAYDCKGCGGITYLGFSYIVQADDYDADGIGVARDGLRLNGATVTDLAGNDADLDLRGHAFSNNPELKVDGRTDHIPAVRSLSIDSAPASGGTYTRGERIRVFIYFDEELTISGFPRLTLTIGARTQFATYQERWGRQHRLLAFHYEVQADDHDPDGLSIAADALHLNGGSILDRTGNAANLSLAGHTVTNDPDHRVDGRGTSTPVVASLGWGGSGQGDDGTYVKGNEIGVYINFNKPVVVTGSPTLALTIGAEVRQARFEQLTESKVLYFAYTVQADDHDSDGLSIGADALRLNGGRIRDAVGLDADLSLAGHVVDNDPRRKVDGGIVVAPMIDFLEFLTQPSDGEAYRRGEQIIVRIGFDEGIAVTGAPVLEMTIGTETRRARWIVFNRRGYIQFSYEVQPADLDLDGLSIGPNALKLNGGSIVDADGNAAKLELGRQTVRDDPAHKVDGGGVRVTGSLAPLQLTVGAPETVELSEVFGGDVTAYGATSSDAHVAEASVSGSALTVLAVAEGTATIEATARGEFGMASLQFLVTAVTDPVEVEALESTLAAMGRSMLSSVTGALQGRFAEASKSSTVTVAGHRVPVAADAEAVRAHRGGVAADTAAAARPVSVHSAVAGGLPSGRLTGESWLRSSRFMLVVDTPQAGDAVGDRGTRWTVWGSGDWQSFTGEPGNGIGYNGSLRTVHVGADVGGERWLAGAFVSRAAGKAAYRFGTTNGAGNLQATLTSVQPYFRWAPSRETEVWLTAGVGSGTLELEQVHARGRLQTSDLSMRLAVVGGRQVLASVGRVDLALRGDVGLVRLETRGGAQVFEGVAANVQRYRVGLETSHTTRWSNGATLTPFAEINGRRDDGGGEVGSGVEVEGGVRLMHSRIGFGLEARGRALVMHTAAGYREHGFGVTARLTPGGTDGRGLSVSVTPGWGAPVGGVDALWREQALGRGGAAMFDHEGASMEAQVGYGFAMRAGHVLAPFGEMGAYGAEHRRLRAGVRLGRAAGAALPLQVELAGERSETGQGLVDHRLSVIGTLAF